MKLWIDDTRPAPDDAFVTCKDIFEVMKFIHSLENTKEKIDFISFDYYIDPKNHSFTGNHYFTGIDAINEITFFDHYVWPILSNDFSFSTHSSEKSCNERMTEKMNEYLKERKIKNEC